jgi:hypothetical protein
MVPLADLWSLARGMPAVDVAVRAAELAGEQTVENYSEA